MTKKLSIALATVAVALLLAWRMCGDADKASKSPRKTATTSDKQPVRTATVSRPSQPTDSMAAEFDEEREGDLVLEGQVIDDTEDPVAGALVTLRTTPRRTVKTGEDGSFSFDKLIGRTYTLVAQSDTGAGGPVAARLTADSEPVILRLRPAASVRVRVLDELNNEPVSGADVELRGVMRQRATTDADGIATLSGLPRGFYQLAASASSYAASFERLRVPSGDAALNQEVRLRAGAPVTGRVLDKQGQPLAQARVVYRQGSAGWRQQADGRYDAVLTDAQGNFRFPALSAGGVYFQADHTDHARGYSETIDLDGVTERTGIEIRLDKGVTVAGRVVDGNRAPVPYAGVRTLISASGQPWRMRPRQSFTDEQGEFEIAGLPRDTVKVLAAADSATSATVELDLSEVTEKRGVELMVDQNGRIAGVVVDSNGEPVDGAQVSARPDFQRGRGRAAMRAMFSEMRLRGRSQVLSDAGGRFEFTGLPASDYAVSATPPGVSGGRRGRFGRRGDGVAAKVGDTEVRIELSALASISGKVAFADGSNPELFTVSTGGFRSPAKPFSSKDGKFSVGDLQPGSYNVVIRGAGFDDKHLQSVEVSAGEDVDVGTVTVVKGRSVSGRVVDASGAPVENATVHVGRRLRGSGTDLSSNSGGPFALNTKTSTTDEKGYYSIQGLPAGALAIVAEHPVEGRSSAMELPVNSIDITDLNLAVVPPGAIAGTVTAAGQPVAAARVTAQSQTIASISYRVEAGPDGAYRFERLAPDSYLVTASVGGFRGGGSGRYSQATAVQSGQTVQIDLRIDAGSVDVVVTLVPAEGSAGFTFVRAAQGELQARNARELDIALANRTSGFSSFGFTRRGSQVRIEDAPAGALTVCALPLPTEISDPGAMGPYMEREGDRLPVFCQAVNVAESPAEQQVALPITVPAFVPPPAE